MTEDKEQVSFSNETDELEKQDKEIVVISSSEELLTFLLDILDFGDNVDSEEILENNNSYKILSMLLRKIPVLTIAIEHKYVDRIYRDSYYMHFSCKHGKYERFCKRLFLFEGNLFVNEPSVDFPDLDEKMLQEKFIGTIVVRPLKEGKIGRVLISPYFLIEQNNTYMRYAKYSATIYGIRLQINAFPFSMQDGETTTCAEITILNLMDYFSRKYSEYRSILPSEIAEATERNGYERNMPSRGLGYPVITKVFGEAGFSPRLYSRNLFADMSQFKRIMHYFIESGLPVAVGVRVDDKTRHSVVCIGHGEIQYNMMGKKIYAIYDTMGGNYIWLIDSADLCDNYIVMDDGHSPYENFEWKSTGQNGKADDKSTLGTYEPDTLMVPLYKRMFLEAQDAYDICTSALASKEVGIQRFNPELGTKKSPVIIRLFMCSSRNYKQRRITNFGMKNKEVRERYINLLLPRFVWVCEIYNNSGYVNGRVIGEIVIDATASPYDGSKSILLFHYPYHILVCQRNIKNVKRLFDKDENFEQVNDWEPFARYDHNLFTPKEIKANENR